MEFSARELAKLDARRRVFQRAYVTFDHLEPECRAHWREHGGWNPPALRRCKARCCAHVEKIPNGLLTAA
jgi:hypothetical protein